MGNVAVALIALIIGVGAGILRRYLAWKQSPSRVMAEEIGKYNPPH